MHRQAQARLGVAAIAQLRAVFRLLDPKAVDATFERWLAVVTPIVAANRATSAQLAGAYLTAFKQIEHGGPVDIVTASPADVAALATSMLVTGPVAYKLAARRGVGLAQAATIAETRTSGAGMRFVLEGGRDTILNTLRSDGDAKGFVRVAAGNACAFCSELEGKHANSDEAFPAHDHCSCTAEPVYA